MYSGEVIEEGTIDSLFSWPKHPYTHGLFGCIPLPTADKNAAPLKPIKGQLPLPFERPQGCYFGPRCDHFESDRCEGDHVEMEPVIGSAADHRVRCLRWNEIEIDCDVPAGAAQTAIKVGKQVLEVKKMKKYYEVINNSFNAIISGKRVRQVKANEELNFVAHEGENSGDCRGNRVVANPPLPKS